VAAKEVFPKTTIFTLPVPTLTAATQYYVTATYVNNDGDTSTQTTRYAHVVPQFDATVENYTVSPTAPAPGQNITISVTLRNKGTANWTANARTNLVTLTAVHPKAGEGWTPAPISLPPTAVVKPGQAYTFTFTRPAPAVGGAWRLAWQPVARAGATRNLPFGDVTPMEYVTVN
jgi:uncharacterized repeat protein (TIGR01451 family)